MPGDTARENGKKGGRPKGSKARHTLEASALRAYLIEEVVKAKSGIVKALIEKAKDGDTVAIREVLDRSLGKSKEQVELSGNINTNDYKNLTTEQLIALLAQRGEGDSEEGAGEEKA